MTKLILASTSPARLALLRAGGIDPVTIAPGVDEDAVAERATAMGLISNTAEMVHVLAKAKAEAAARYGDESTIGVDRGDVAVKFLGIVP